MLRTILTFRPLNATTEQHTHKDIVSCTQRKWPPGWGVCLVKGVIYLHTHSATQNLLENHSPIVVFSSWTASNYDSESQTQGGDFVAGEGGDEQSSSKASPADLPDKSYSTHYDAGKLSNFFTLCFFLIRILTIGLMNIRDDAPSLV